MIRQTRLPNGLRIATFAMPHLETAAVALSVDTGARHEDARHNGLAHLFEHMVFKGTTQRSARRIAEEAEDVGGSINAYTARDVTVFHARMLAEDLALGLDIIADLVRNPIFDAQDLERERQVVLQELGESRDTPDDIIYDHLQNAAFPDQPLGRPILGDETSIAAIDVAALKAWQQQHYCADTIVLTAAGKLDHDVLVAQAEKLLGDLPTSQRSAILMPRYVGGDQVDPRRFEQAHLTLGMAAPGYHDEDHFAAQLFAVAVGGGMSSRLFQELREERGLAYSIYASHSPYVDAGLLSIYMATAPDQAAHALDLSMEILRASAATLDTAELVRAKAQAKAATVMALESPTGQAETMGRQLLLFDRLVSAREVMDRIDVADLDAVRAAGAAMLASPLSRASVGCVLPA